MRKNPTGMTSEKQQRLEQSSEKLESGHKEKDSKAEQAQEAKAKELTKELADNSELKKKVYRYEAKKALRNTQAYLLKSYYDILKTTIEDARNAWVDVSDIEEQMPELEKKVNNANRTGRLNDSVISEFKEQVISALSEK